MAVGATAGPAPEFVMYVDSDNVRIGKPQTKRAAVVAAGLMACALVAGVMLLGNQSGKAELLQDKATDTSLAAFLVRNVQTASVPQLMQAVRGWKNVEVTDLASFSTNTQMLSVKKQSWESMLQESGKLCEKKDFIFAKFNTLLSKLKVENKERNETDAAAYEEKESSLQAWLDAEAEYRLQKEKVKEADEGAAYARSQYEKWSATVTETQARLTKMNVDYPKEKGNIQLERELIKEILRLLGVLADAPQPAVAAKAHPLTLKQVQAKVALLKKHAEDGGPITLKQVNMLNSQLASFGETDEVKKLLEAMLKDLDQREGVIDKALKVTQDELTAHKAELVKYEKDVVDLSNAGDEAKQASDAADLKRQDLNGKKVTSDEAYTDEHAEFEITFPPAEKSIFIIKEIMKKIDAFCTAKA